MCCKIIFILVRTVAQQSLFFIQKLISSAIYIFKKHQYIWGKVREFTLIVSGYFK